METLPGHYEKYLGTIDVGWQRDHLGVKMPFQVVRFAHPGNGGVAFATLGLSNHPLTSRTSGRSFRQELLMLLPSTHHESSAPALLQQVGAQLLESGAGLLRGDVMGPRGPLFGNSAMTAMYAAVPVYLPDEFHVFHHGGGFDVVITWLVPITAGEAHFVAHEGWRRFEDQLVESDPDLTDLNRDSVVP